MKDLIQTATQTRERAHAPYSGHKVGAAIRTSDGRIFGGCNVENSSYGGTVCAERVAIQNAVASVGKFKLAEVTVVTDVSPPWSPCGFCRQVMVEFGDAHTRIHAVNLLGEKSSWTLGQLLPEAFTPAHLAK